MEQENQTNQYDELDQKWDTTPQEVQDFLISPGYELLLSAIAEGLKLSPEAKVLLEEGTTNLIIRAQTMEELALLWQQQGLSAEKIVQILYAIHAEIITRVDQIVEFYTEEDSDEVVEKTGQSIEKVLETLGQRLAETKMAPLTKRDYSLEKMSQTEPRTQATKTIDPYRELPEV